MESGKIVACFLKKGIFSEIPKVVLSCSRFGFSRKPVYPQEKQFLHRALLKSIFGGITD